MRGLAYAFGLAAGLGLTIQVAMNSQLRKVMQSAYSAALVSFLVGTTALVAMVLVTRTTLPSRDTFAAVPLWAWFGGLFGAFYVAISTVVAAELGAASLLALALAGQLAMALVVDHYGWLGMPESRMTWVRLAGVVLLCAGAWLVTRRSPS
jgi:bacterial/archaeal transporter family-2 protein